MSTQTPTYKEARSMQSGLEVELKKLENAGVLEGNACDHIRVVVADGIAAKFGERYRTYPRNAPRLDELPIRRDVAGRCVLYVKRGTAAGAVAGAAAAAPATPTAASLKKHIAQWVNATAAAGEPLADDTIANEPMALTTLTNELRALSPITNKPITVKPIKERVVDHNARLAVYANKWDAILEAKSATSRGTSPSPTKGPAVAATTTAASYDADDLISFSP